MACVGTFHNMRICLLGYTGFVGKTVYDYLRVEHDVCGLCSTSALIPTEEFDIVVNCAGSSKKYLAQKDPAEDFRINMNVLHTLLKLDTKRVVHISSIDARSKPDNNYTISKIITERYIQLYFPDAPILRLGGMVGPNLKKNVVFDIVNNKDIFITFDSICNYISTQEVARVVEKVIDLNIKGKTITVAASKPIKVNEIIEEARKLSMMFDKSEGSKKEDYEQVDLEELNKFFDVKDSKHYIKEYLRSI